MNPQAVMRGRRLVCTVLRNGATAAQTAPLITNLQVGMVPCILTPDGVSADSYAPNAVDTNVLLPATAPGVLYVMTMRLPVALGVGDTIPALMAGNAVVQKADNQTALTALFALELAHQAGLPEDLWQIVLGRGSAIGTPLLDIADYVMFTGSTASGRHIAREAGERLVDCSLELGGKNAMLVLDDADIDRTVEGAVRACFSSSGQLCISIERMFVADAIYDLYSGWAVGAPSAGPACSG